MSNGIGANPLNAISKVYLEQIAEKKDDTYLEPDMKKRQKNNEKARKDMEKMGTSMKNPHFEEKQQGWDAVNSLAGAYKAVHEGIRDEDPEKGTAERKARLEKKRGMKMDDHPQYAKEGLDPVGKEDGDINNDGKKDSTDSYLMKRRKAIGKAIKSKMKEDVENIEELHKGRHGQSEKEYQDSRSDAGKMVSGDSKMSGSAYSSRSMGSTGPNPAGGSKKPEGQGRMTSGARTDLQFRKMALKKKAMKEELSSWRQDLSEIMTDDIDSKPIKEKKNIKNTIKINPKLGESVEKLGGEILEMVEVDQFDGVVEEVFQDLLSEGYSEKNVRDAIESGIEEARITYGHDTSSDAEGMRDKLKKKAKGFLAKVAVKAYNKAREAKAAATPAMQRAKTSAKRGIRKAALKVADKLKEETIDEAVYGGAQPERKDTRMVVTNADKKANTPAYQKMKAGDKRYKAADHMNEGDGDPCWDTHKQVGMKKKGNRMVPNCVPKNEEVEFDEKFSMAADPSKPETARPTRKAENKKGMSMKSRAVKAIGTQRRQDKETGVTEEMSTQELALQKRKANIDQMIAKRRKQELSKGVSPTKTMGEEASDAMKDRRMERGGVGGNVDYRRPPATPNLAGKKKPYDGMSALEKVKASIRAKHGQGAIIDTKKK